MGLSCVSLATLMACTGPYGADQAELANIKPSNIVPKSSPSQLVKVFDQFCTDAPRRHSEHEAALRNASYVPKQPRQISAPQVFLVDDLRPAVAVSDTVCMVQARSRTGQTERVADYVAARFANAKPLDPAPLGHHIERAWSVSLPDAAVIATERRLTLDGVTSFSVILFRPDRPMTN